MMAEAPRASRLAARAPAITADALRTRYPNPPPRNPTRAGGDCFESGGAPAPPPAREDQQRQAGKEPRQRNPIGGNERITRILVSCFRRWGRYAGEPVKE